MRDNLLAQVMVFLQYANGFTLVCAFSLVKAQVLDPTPDPLRVIWGSSQIEVSVKHRTYDLARSSSTLACVDIFATLAIEFFAQFIQKRFNCC